MFKGKQVLIIARLTTLGGIGFEPTTSCVSSRRSKPTELTALKNSVIIVSFKKYKKASGKTAVWEKSDYLSRTFLTTAAAERVCWVLLLSTVIVI